MPIVYIHGVAVRDQHGKLIQSRGDKVLGRLLQDITWETVEGHLRAFIASEISQNAASVKLFHAYWGDLAAKLAWEGASCLPAEAEREPSSSSFVSPAAARSRLLADLRHPLNVLGARFFGDVFCYLNNRGDAELPGPIPQRILDTLELANQAKLDAEEPLVVLTNSMGGQIMYDIVTYFLPGSKRYEGIHVDYWCSVASQVGLFEEMKLFMVSSPQYSKAAGNKVPFPGRKHLGIWWNVWDVDDVISYSVQDIIEGVEETLFSVGVALFKEHVGYLQEESFYRLFAEKLSKSL